MICEIYITFVPSNATKSQLLPKKTFFGNTLWTISPYGTNHADTEKGKQTHIEQESDINLYINLTKRI